MIKASPIIGPYLNCGYITLNLAIKTIQESPKIENIIKLEEE
jgi:hypothetical protein